MRKTLLYLASFLLVTSSLAGLDKPEDPSTELAAEASPAGLIAGCVDLTSGGFVLRDSDVHSYGPDPFSFTRIYSSNVQRKSYWGDYSGCALPLKIQPNKEKINKRYSAQVHLRENSPTYFHSRKCWQASKGKASQGLDYSISEAIYNLGATHYPKGEHDLRNIELWKHKVGDWSMRSGCGTERYYKSLKASSTPSDTAQVHLYRERLPSGNMRHYLYDKEQRLTELYTSNAKGDKSWNHFHIEHGNDGYELR